MTREEAKALIIDAAYNEAFVSNCQNKTSDSDYLGHGVVPIHIDKLIKTENDEIKVVMHQKIDQYENFNYRFPVPISNKKQNFIARATLCYSPYCSRAQGVDYTCTELDLHFGRMKPDKMVRLRSIPLILILKQIKMGQSALRKMLEQFTENGIT